MAIHYLQSNMDVDGESFELGEIRDDPTYDDDSDFQTAETRFGGGTIDVAPVETPLTLSLEEEKIRKVVDTAYKKWNDDSGGPPEGVIQYNKFRISPVGGLMLKVFPDLWLMNKNTGEPRALSTIAGEAGGLAAIRDVMGYEDYGKVSQKSRREMAAALPALLKTNDDLAIAQAKIKSLPPQDLPAAVSSAEKAISSIVETMETTLSEVDASLPLREIRGLDKALQTIRGELVNNLAKLTELDNHITREQNKLDEPDIGEFERRRIAERIRDLKDERVSRLEAASASREALRSQISRIRETINRLINEDTTLAERIRTLFREQGITIVSILTALGMVISTLVLAISGGSAVVVPTPPSKGGLREWVKKYLHALGRVLAKLAAKAGAALPGIIGSVVGWLLNLLSKTAGWLASNLWALMLAVGGILLIAAREWLAIR